MYVLNIHHNKNYNSIVKMFAFSKFVKHYYLSYLIRFSVEITDIYQFKLTVTDHKLD